MRRVHLLGSALSPGSTITLSTSTPTHISSGKTHKVNFMKCKIIFSQGSFQASKMRNSFESSWFIAIPKCRLLFLFPKCFQTYIKNCLSLAKKTTGFVPCIIFF